MVAGPGPTAGEPIGPTGRMSGTILRVMTTTPADPAAPVLERLSRLDRYLPIWIIAAMAFGLALGRLIPDLNDWLDAVKIGSVSLPIALGLLIMMYPVLAKVRYSKMGEITTDRTLMTTSLVLNWVIGPALMFALAWLLLPDLPEYRTGLIIIGLARCIAMVLIWNDLACGDREAAAVLVAINSVFQIVAYSLLGYFYLELLPNWLGLDTATLDVSMWDIAKIVLVFLGIPLAAGYLTRLWGERTRGIEWYESRFLPRLGPWALYGLLFTIVVLFALQGETITSQPWDVARIALPLLVYFGLMWVVSFALGLRLRMSYEKNTSVAFTAASNNFELAIAVAIGVFGVTSGEALAGVVGPLIEVPVLVGLVYVALWARKRFYPLPDKVRSQ
jgi:ACR3 family arsenite transporter